MRLESLNAATVVEISNSAANLVQRQTPFVSNFRGYQSGFRGHHYRGGRGRSYSGGGRSNNQFNTFNKPLCQICGKAGHTALKCFYRYDLRYQNSVSNQTATSSDISSDESPAAIHNSQAYNPSPNIVNDTVWYLNSRATHLVTAEGKSMATKS